MPPRATALIIACATAALASEVHAIGFGRLGASAVLGQPLNLPVPLRLDAGERLEPECVSAEVTLGERTLGRGQVRARLEQGSGTEWVARISTTIPIDEPVVELAVTVGCERKFSRRFVAFADPPSVTAGPAPAMPAPQAGAASTASQAANEAGSTAETPPPSTPRSATRRARAASATAATPTAKRSRKTAPVAAPLTAPAPRVADNGAKLMLDIGGPRLKLDLEDPVLVSPVQPAGPAGSTVDGEAPPPAAVPESERLRTLEKTLSDLQRERQAGNEATAALKQRVADAENRGRAVPWLAALLALALGVSAWLALRLKRQQDAASEQQPHWWTPEAGAPIEPEEAPIAHVPLDFPAEVEEPPEHRPREFVGEHTAPLPAALALERSPSPRPAEAGPAAAAETPFERTNALPGTAPFKLDSAAESATREVSVEELLDLEQQADFFIALGQEDAAVDLLMSHLRSTGGLSPLPYTKLLEIYKRQGDREAYERIRARFNRRFNAYAPEWEPGPASGRALEDYASVMQELQALWATPIDAMATLEAMLFRKDEAHELFDLPAYKDVLMLYALARDLWQQGGSQLAAVDVLLPIEDDGSEPEATAPAPLKSAYVLAPPVSEQQGDDEAAPPPRQRGDEA